MTPTILFVVGEPGVGKTTALRSALGLEGATCVTEGKAKWTRWNHPMTGEVVAAGHYTGAVFDGADRVSYTGARDCLGYWHAHYLRTAALTIMDGDRFASRSTLDWIEHFTPAHRVRVLLLLGAEAADARRTARAERTGQMQNEAWIRGRFTKAINFAGEVDRRWPGALTSVNAGQPAERIAELVARAMGGYLR